MEGTGQQLPTFRVDAVLGQSVVLGQRRFDVIATGGHATGGVSFFDPNDGLLVTGDALWQDGFGLLNPWVDGDGVFDAAADALRALRRIDASVVIPGHGPPFVGLVDALDRADSRLAYLVENPDRLKEQIVRNGVGFFRLAEPDASLDRVAAVARGLSDRFELTPERIAGLLAGPRAH